MTDILQLSFNSPLVVLGDIVRESSGQSCSSATTAYKLAKLNEDHMIHMIGKRHQSLEQASLRTRLPDKLILKSLSVPAWCAQEIPQHVCRLRASQFSSNQSMLATARL